MKTVKEISDITGVTVRSLQYYDKINLLKPAKYSASGYRLYDDQCFEKLQQIMLFKELDFSLKEIKDIMNHSNFDKEEALDQQLVLLNLKKKRLEGLINFIGRIKRIGVDNMNFEAFDKKKINEYGEEARRLWQNTKEYMEFEEKNKNSTIEDERMMNIEMMEIFKDFGERKEEAPGSSDVKALVRRLQDYITEHFFECSNQILLKLGEMYETGEELRSNIDSTGGEGTASFVYQAIREYCRNCIESKE